MSPTLPGPKANLQSHRINARQLIALSVRLHTHPDPHASGRPHVPPLDYQEPTMAHPLPMPLTRGPDAPSTAQRLVAAAAACLATCTTLGLLLAAVWTASPRHWAVATPELSARLQACAAVPERGERQRCRGRAIARQLAKRPGGRIAVR